MYSSPLVPLTALASVVALSGSILAAGPRQVRNLDSADATVMFRRFDHSWGEQSCAYWTQQQRIPVISSQPRLYPSIAAWALAYVAGASHFAPRLDEAKPDTVLDLMDAHCAAHPSQTIKDAAGAVTDELLK